MSALLVAAVLIVAGGTAAAAIAPTASAKRSCTATGGTDVARRACIRRAP